MSDIHHINLAGIDLNLLVVFDALMAERSVTRAGEILGLSQPATSNALARLRTLTHDRLFVRTATGLQPTPKATALMLQVRPALQHIQFALLEEPTFDPRTSDRVFALGMSDYVEFTLLPPLMQRLQAVAPHIAVQIRTGDRAKLLALLDKGDLDVACGFFPDVLDWHHNQVLFHETYACVCRCNHAILNNTITLDDYLSVSHLLISIQEDRIGRVDRLLAEQQLKRHIALSIPHFLTAPFILAQTDLVATLAQRIAQVFAHSQSLQLLPMPLSIPGFSVSMHWHQSADNSAACRWLRSMILEVSQTI